MVERGSWSLCKVFDLKSKTVNFSGSTDNTLVLKVSDILPAGTYPFKIVVKMVNTDSANDTEVQFKDSVNTVLADITIPQGKAGIIDFPPLKDLEIYAKGGSCDFYFEIFLGSVSSEG